MTKIAHPFVDCCGGYNEAIRTIARASRCVWRHFYEFSSDEVDAPSSRRTNSYRTITLDELAEVLDGKIASNALSVLIDSMKSAEVYQHGRLKAMVFNPRGLARNLLGGIRTDADLRYAVMRAIRLHYDLPLSSETVHHFGKMAQEVTELINETRRKRKRASKGVFINVGLQEISEWQTRFHQNLVAANCAASDDISPEVVANASYRLQACFLESCRALGYLSVSNSVDKVQFRTSFIDGEYVISQLFGVPTNISALDQLFGGGGLVLPETATQPAEDPLGLWRERLPARIIVVSGARGTGKSIFASQFAAEIAMRGGVSWYMPLEQSPEECLFALESMGALNPSSANISLDFVSAAAALDDWSDDLGALLILKPQNGESVNSSEKEISPYTEYHELGDFLTTVAGTANSLSCGNVKLVVIDPLNNRIPGPGASTDTVRLRSMLHNAIQLFKNSGTNVLLVVEEQTGILGEASSLGQSKNELLFAENLADVIIRLSTSKKHNYATRFFEIKKSRTQREQRGEHAFSIRPGEGICIVPSVASFHARFKQRQLSGRIESVSFGLQCVDEILGRRSLYRGDVVVLTGDSGTYKTQLGLPFLLADDKGKAGLNRGYVSLLFSTRDDIVTTRSFLEDVRLNGSKSSAPGKIVDDDSLRIIPIPVGHVRPGAILQIISEEVKKVELEGKKLHRVLIDNIALWETCSPAVAEDATLAVTLVEFLKTLRRTCLLVCGVPSIEGPGLQRSFIGLADCLIQFDRYEFRGVSRVMMRVLKSHKLGHRRDAFEVSFEKGRFSITPSISLLRRNHHSGAFESIPIRLLFHTESELQRNYFTGLRDSLFAVASPKTTLEIQDRVAQCHSYGMGMSSAIDELQILEIDEFQLGSGLQKETDSVPLKTFGIAQGPGKQLEEVLSRYSKKCWVKSKEFTGMSSSMGYRAVPFLSNIGLLAFDKECIDEKDTKQWYPMAELCWEWERTNSDFLEPDDEKTPGAKAAEAKLFFEHPRGSGENFNCLFFEILLSLQEHPVVRDGECAIREWLSSDVAIKAGAILRILCRRAYRTCGGQLDSFNWQAGRIKGNTEGGDEDIYRVSHQAIVYRHWYTTLNEMFRDMNSSGRGARKASQLQITALPGHVGISGEWYLGIPLHSAAADTGINIIEDMVSPEAELTRVRLGVGLPTRKQYYEPPRGTRHLAVSPFFNMDAQTAECLVTNAFSRSNFRCYKQVSQTLAHHLKRLVEAPWDHESSFEIAYEGASHAAAVALNAALGELDFVQGKSGRTNSTEPMKQCRGGEACKKKVQDGLQKVCSAIAFDKKFR